MIVVIGVGNPLRRDDGVGPAAAEVIARELTSHIALPRLILAHQLTPEIAIDLSDPGVDAVLFVDAAVDVERAEVLELPFPTDQPAHGSSMTPAPPSSAGASHHVGPQTVLAYTGLLRTTPLRAWVVRLPAFDLTHGEGLSEPARAALEELPALCRDLVQHLG